MLKTMLRLCDFAMCTYECHYHRQKYMIQYRCINIKYDENTVLKKYSTAWHVS